MGFLTTPVTTITTTITTTTTMTNATNNTSITTYLAFWRGQRCEGQDFRLLISCAPSLPRPWKRSWVFLSGLASWTDLQLLIRPIWVLLTLALGMEEFLWCVHHRLTSGKVEGLLPRGTWGLSGGTMETAAVVGSRCHYYWRCSGVYGAGGCRSGCWCPLLAIRATMKWGQGIRNLLEGLGRLSRKARGLRPLKKIKQETCVWVLWKIHVIYTYMNKNKLYNKYYFVFFDQISRQYKGKQNYFINLNFTLRFSLRYICESTCELSLHEDSLLFIHMYVKQQEFP